MDDNTKAHGKMMKEAEKDLKGMRTEIHTLVCSRMEKRTEQESTLGQMERFTTENGIKA